jgi:hypothetical protein
MNIDPAIERARLWWRSRTPEEKEAGISAWMDKITPIVCITVPKPFCGRIEVFISGMRKSSRKEVNVSERALIKLRDLFLEPSKKKWRAVRRDKCVQFIHGGELRKWNDPRSGGSF